MFERFTERARQVVVLAQEEARALGHGHIGTEHILLGLLRESDGLGARALKSLDLSLPDLRADVVRLTAAPELPPGAPSPFTPLAKSVLESALREALNLSHNYIGTEHVLLGMMDVSDGLAAKILLEHGVDQEMVGERVSSMLAASQEQRIQRVVSTGAGFRSATISGSRSGPGALVPSEVLAFARRDRP